MTDEGLRKNISEKYGEDVVVFENPSFDSAVIGIDKMSHRLIYDYDKMVACLAEEYLRDKAAEDEEDAYNMAVDWVEFNTLRSLPYFPNSPLVLYSHTEEDYADLCV